MDSSRARISILKDLRDNTKLYDSQYTPLDSVEQYFNQPKNTLSADFKSALEFLSGTCFICQTEQQALEKILEIITDNAVYCLEDSLQTILAKNNISYKSDEEFSTTALFSVTTCIALSARTGSVLVSSQQLAGRRSVSAPETHIVIANESQISADLPEVLSKIDGKNLPSQITVITGPSRTADIEKTLVLGAHGPKKLIVFIIQS